MKQLISALVILMVALVGRAANTVETVTQVTADVQLTTDVDYIVTSATPFAGNAVVDIVNTDHATLILLGVKPSEAKKLLSHVRINGAAANGSNAMVKIYRAGSIIMPYGSSLKPLTVFADKDSQGQSEQYGVSQRVSLAGKAMNNTIESFTLKRGYMVWFATKANGTGYNRLYIADKYDLKIDLPDILSNSISALRVSKWNDCDKKGYAGNDQTVNAALNTTWCYNWDDGVNIWDDREYVTQHHHEGWPGIEGVGNNGTSANILGNNEPDNTGDAKEKVSSVAQVLATWPQMMATGRRLGSPAMSGNLNWLYEFIDSIDARGWRCDFVAVHAYWYSDWNSWKNQLTNIHNRTGRPIWITEMNYGANWTGWPGANTEGNADNYAIEKQHFAPVIDGLESTPWMERYAVYNWVQDCRKVWDGNQLTPMGEYYAAKESGMAYSSDNLVVPKLPKMRDPDKIAVRFNGPVAHITWHEYNGEYNRSITLQRRNNTASWTDVADITPQEDAADYAYDDADAENGCRYRIRVIDAAGKERFTKERTAVKENLTPGETVTVNGATKYVGGNVFVNGDFDLGLSSYTSGDGTPLAAPYFQVPAAGSMDDGSYLQAWSDGAKGSPATIWTTVDVAAQSDYYASVAACLPASPMARFCLSTDGSSEDKTAFLLSKSDLWAASNTTFNTGDYTKVIFSARSLGAKAEFDKLCLYRLFDSEAEAIGDGIAQMKRRAEAVATFIGDEVIAPELRSAATSATGSDAATLTLLTSQVSAALVAFQNLSDIREMKPKAELAIELKMPGYEQVETALNEADLAVNAAQITAAYTALQDALAHTWQFEETTLVVNGDFANATTGWIARAGSYTGGSQAVTSMGGVRAFNAQWTGVPASEGEAKSMAIKQTIAKVPHGIYSLECDATTQHYCLSDQHAWLTYGEQTVNSPALTHDVADIYRLSDQDLWQTLATDPIYVDENGSITFGFTGTKQGAVDNLWRAYGDATSTGDQREGSWSVTGFRLKHHPVYRRTVEPNSWNALCLSRAHTAGQGVQMYKIGAITSNFQQLILVPVDTVAAGMPCYFYSTVSNPIFYETGGEQDEALTDDTNLRGFYITTSKARQGTYAIIDNIIKRVGSTNRPAIGNFGAVLLSVVGIPVSDTLEGTRIAIEGADQEMADGISTPIVNVSATPVRRYTLTGQPANARTRGLVIEVKDGKARVRTANEM